VASAAPGVPTPPTWAGLLAALLRREDLSPSDAAWAMQQVMAGEATAAQVAGFLVALRAKGETVGEISGLVQAMLDAAVRITVPGRTVDVVGTGGDRAHTVNISTMAAVVVAGAGERVVKHGNRAASSACGSADLLEELGVRLTLPPEVVARVAQEVGITFCFAQTFHPSMRHAAAPRRELGVPTAFNFLGPLTNPAQPKHQAVGVADRRMAGIIAGVLAERGNSSLVFRGEDGLDELTTTTSSRVWVVRDGRVEETLVHPVDLGVDLVDPAALRGADRAYNAAVARRVLAGEHGPVRDAVLLNAAAALATLEPTDAPLTAALRAGLSRAAEAVDSGAAAAVLDRWVQVTSSLAGR
jgi:anthranilate phosphoribosyltransferase